MFSQIFRKGVVSSYILLSTPITNIQFNMFHAFLDTPEAPDDGGNLQSPESQYEFGGGATDLSQERLSPSVNTLIYFFNNFNKV